MLVKNISMHRVINVSYLFKDRYGQIDKKSKILIASNSSSLTQHLFVPGNVLYPCHQLSFQSHCDVATMAIHILTIRIRMVHSANVTQLMNARARTQSRPV